MAYELNTLITWLCVNKWFGDVDMIYLLLPRVDLYSHPQTDFHITILQCGETRRTLEAGIETRLTLH